MILGTLSGVLAGVGAFMPWVTVGIFSVDGTSGDGVLTLVLGLAMTGIFIAWGLTGQGLRGLLGLTILAGAGVIAIAIYDIAHIQSIADEDAANILALNAGVGTGLYVTLFAGFGEIIASFIGAAR